MVALRPGPVAPVILGLAGTYLRPDEKAYIQARQPLGFLLFARNIENPEQVRELCADLSELSTASPPLIAVDQEGGRVQRLKFAGAMPPARAFGDWHAHDPEAALEAVKLDGLLLAAELSEVGANWVMAPVLDRAHEVTHAIIGDRSFSGDIDRIVALAGAFDEGVAEGGCWSCLKHAPGHGLAAVDSHKALPQVDASLAELENDMAPFARMAAGADFMMTAHIQYKVLDGENPATFSPSIVAMMRKDWRFNGLILADDVGMQALDGSYTSRIKRALAAGCDVAIASMSLLREGMAGTVFDEAHFAELQQAELPDLSGRARAFVEGLYLPEAPDTEKIACARDRLRALWADGPARMGYKFDL